MKTDRFVKMMLVIIASLLLLNCGGNITKIDSSDNTMKPPQIILDVLINRAKEVCQNNKWECKDFKINTYEEIERDDADKANEIEKKGYASLTYIKRANSTAEWENSLETLAFKLKKNGDIQKQFDVLIPKPKKNK